MGRSSAEILRQPDQSVHKPIDGLAANAANDVTSPNLFAALEESLLPGANSIAVRIVAVVLVLSAVAAVLGVVAIQGFEGYNRRVQEIDRASAMALTGEQINGTIYQVVMDSRGVYMSGSAAESEKYAPLMLQGIARLRELAGRWEQLAGTERSPEVIEKKTIIRRDD